MSSVIQINPSAAFELLKNDSTSVLVDVRTHEEFNFVGVPNAAEFGNRLILLPWQTLPGMELNHEFTPTLEEEVQKLFGDKSLEAKIIFLCRTGGRSNQAANQAINLGYKNCYNVSSGFEGELNNLSQRGQISGWKADSLPWRQK